MENSGGDAATSPPAKQTKYSGWLPAERTIYRISPFLFLFAQLNIQQFLTDRKEYLL